MMTIDLYTASDVKRVRDLLLEEQGGYCKVTGLKIPDKQAVLDHAHDDEQIVRGVLHRQVNAWIGKCENAHNRLLVWWYPHSLPQVLRLVADYLENSDDTRFRHPGWIKKINTEFNKLKESSKDAVLQSLGQSKGSNAKQRKELFRKSVLSRQFGYEFLKNLIKEKTNA